MELNLSEQVGRAVGGDMEALTSLLEHFGPIVRRGLSIGKRWWGTLDADDVMQVTYLEAFMRIGEFDPNRAGSFEAWLRRIAENNLRDAVKVLSADKRPPPERRFRAPAGEGRSTQQFLVDLADEGGANVASCVATSEGERLLLDAIEALPADYRTVVRMCDIEGRAASEAAAAMSRSTGAIYMLRARAHDRLREVLGPASRYLSSVNAPSPRARGS
jgi:RNA polymerase sigma-70 factor (ECF subfamily)